MDIPASMQSGGGPACLRLRVVLTGAQEKAISGRVLLTDDLLKELRGLIRAEYLTKIDDHSFVDQHFLRRCFETSRRLYALLGLTPYGIA